MLDGTYKSKLNIRFQGSLAALIQGQFIYNPTAVASATCGGTMNEGHGGGGGFCC